jgi:RHS repeat-associated protein
VPDFQENIAYDPNGNIRKYRRNGNNTFAGEPLAMDSLNYCYIPGTNRLDHITDSVLSAYPGYNDLTTQSAGNYQYDSIGELTADAASNITRITWTVYGKIDSITKATDTTISFTYDAGGNRVSKSVVHAGDTLTTWYVRDAQGNILSIYTYGDPSVNGMDLTQTELDIYGGKRLGTWKRNVNVQLDTPNNSISIPLLNSGDSINFSRGNKLFELLNHLGNVLSTVSDKRFGVSMDDSTVAYYNPEVVSANDYYPFGSLEPYRTYTEAGSINYRYGFNGKENDNEVKGVGDQIDYGERVYDPRVGRFLSVDPKGNLDHNVPLSPYSGMADNPISYIDPTGEDYGVKIDYTTKTIIFVSNVYTTSDKTYNQALKGASEWNKFNKDGKFKISGYVVKFEVDVKRIPDPTDKELKDYRAKYNGYKDGDKVSKRDWAVTSDWVMKDKLAAVVKSDDIGNSYYGYSEISGISKRVSGETFVGGQTLGGKDSYMNRHDELGDLGAYGDLVGHEFGHQFGLSDAGGKYYKEGGIMQYSGLYLKPVSEDDVMEIFQYAKDYLAKPGDFINGAKVKVLEQTGTKDDKNPLGIK